MGHEDKGTTFGEDLLQRRKSGADTGVVSDVEILVKRDVEIHPDNGLLAFKIVRIDVLLHSYEYLLSIFFRGKDTIFLSLHHHGDRVSLR